MYHNNFLYQYIPTENNYLNDLGKGENIWDHLVHTSPELIRDGTNGDIACDSYHKYKEDVALAKNLNVLNYFFFIIQFIIIHNMYFII